MWSLGGFTSPYHMGARTGSRLFFVLLSALLTLLFNSFGCGAIQFRVKELMIAFSS